MGIKNLQERALRMFRRGMAAAILAYRFNRFSEEK
jgi:hypothetical protein